MSSLLERMIQRTRAPLAGIEPLVEARYAQANGQVQMDPPMETSQTSSHASEVVRNRWEVLPAPHDQPAARVHDQHAPEIPPPVHRMLEAAPARATDAETVRSGSGKSLARHLETRLSPNIGEATGRQPRAGTASISRPLPASAVAVVSSAASHSTNDRTIEAQRRQAEPVKMRQSASKAFSSQQQATPRIEKEPAKDDTSVTISIGHIEVRAAQAAERPRRPAFRPRVSLNDFLSRQNGARP